VFVNKNQNKFNFGQPIKLDRNDNYTLLTHHSILFIYLFFTKRLNTQREYLFLQKFKYKIFFNRNFFITTLYIFKSYVN